LSSLSARWPVDELRRVLVPLLPWRPPLLGDDVRAATTERAERAASEPLPALPATRFLEYARTGVGAPYFETYSARRRILRDLVVGEALERAGRFVDGIIDAVWSICEETWWGGPAHVFMQGGEPGLPDADDHLVDLFAAETAGALAWTVHLVGDVLQQAAPAVTRRIHTEVRRRVLDPCETRDFWWMGISDVGWMGTRGGPRIVNNWNPWICSNWIAGAVLLEDDAERRARAVAKALVVLDQYLAVVPPDGSCEEGAAYWSRAAGTLFDALELLSDATRGAIDVFDHPVIAELARFLPRIHLAGPWFANFGDGSPRPDLPAGVVYRYGTRIGDASVCALGAELVDRWRREGPADPIESLGRSVRTLEVVEEARAAPRAAARPSFIWLPGDQVMVARDAAGSTRGFALACRGGHNGAPHGHNDIGSFIVMLDGEPLVIDAGVGTYTAQTFGPERFQLWTMRSAYHNVPFVAGTEQAAGADHAAELLRCVDGADRAELVLDLRGAYPDEVGIERWERSISLERGHGVVVVDSWTLHRPAPVELHLLFRDEPVVDIDTGALRFEHAVIGFEPRPARLEVEPVPLDDPTLTTNWDREQLWRAVAEYAESPAGSVRTRVSRA
jgi:hypothetical protein